MKWDLLTSDQAPFLRTFLKGQISSTVHFLNPFFKDPGNLLVPTSLIHAILENTVLITQKYNTDM